MSDAQIDLPAVGGLVKDLFEKLGSTEGQMWRRALTRFLRKEDPWDKVPTVRPIGIAFSLDYDQPLEALVKQGNYDYTNPDLSSANFLPPHKGKVMLQGGQLVHFGQGVSTAQAERELDQRGLRPADIYELATFGMHLPKTQLEHPIVALGQRWRGGGVECVGYLSRDWRSGCRYFDLRIVEDDWHGDCRFLSFPK
ncbi:MAG: hypothetical protein Q8P45_00895 [Candidatus Harrisonbacteria bacterium]|nr:hypothetical protein [Candidatus Harrisonbacteria bacterium]